MKKTCNNCKALSMPQGSLANHCELGYQTKIGPSWRSTERMPAESCPKPTTIKAFVQAKNEGRVSK